jgi:hypothetical protein
VDDLMVARRRFTGKGRGQIALSIVVDG